MIDRLENVSYVETYTDEYGNYLSASRKTRLPNNEEIIQKINEIIDYINAKEIEPTIKSHWLDKEKKKLEDKER